MLGESHPYKQDLLRLANKFRRWHEQPKWSEARLFSYEKQVFTAFFLVRRLAESHKLSTSLVQRTIPVQVFPATGERVTVLSRDDVWDLYDLQSPRLERRPLLFICNQLIHSYVFQIWLERSGRSSSIFFSSDRERRRAAYRITRGTLQRIWQSVGRNYPSIAAAFEYDEKFQDYNIQME